jgi:hypothetical protein
MYKKKSFVTFSVILILFIGCFGYFQFKGTPWGKASFAKKVEVSIKAKYPKVVIKQQVVTYSFKEMNYSSIINTQSGINIHVENNYDNSLQDDYYTAIWETKVTNTITSYIQKNIESSARARFFIYISNDEMEQYEKYDSYAQFSENIQDKSKLFLNFSGQFEMNTDNLEKCFRVIEWIKSQNYKTTLIFYYKEKPVIRIKSKDIYNINSWQDVKKYIVV